MNTIIGGSDGPTAVFLAGKLGDDWFNPFGLFFILMMLLPNVLYAVKSHGKKKDDINRSPRFKVMTCAEQIGRYASMFLMIFNIGILEYGFFSFDAITIYLMVNLMLLAVYSIIWLTYFKKETFLKSMLLAVIPVCMFLFSGIIMRHVLLIVSALVFGAGHIYITYQTTASIKND